mmetsp:Transcript_7329/g.19157  ORF Transcript_7329/g.19157 Transcript_7329/m.19157 type:complete len:110 (+) Transcript_7329:3-332(+)
MMGGFDGHFSWLPATVIANNGNDISVQTWFKSKIGMLRDTWNNSDNVVINEIRAQKVAESGNVFGWRKMTEDDQAFWKKAFEHREQIKKSENRSIFRLMDALITRHEGQ